MHVCVCRPSCAAPAATPETRRRCSPSVSTCSATNVWRCVTTPGRGSAPSATVPSAPTTSTASTSPNSPSNGRKQQTEPKRGRCRREDSGAEDIFNEADTLRGFLSRKTWVAWLWSGWWHCEQVFCAVANELSCWCTDFLYMLSCSTVFLCVPCSLC